jgi:hypothetical protein
MNRARKKLYRLSGIVFAAVLVHFSSVSSGYIGGGNSPKRQTAPHVPQGFPYPVSPFRLDRNIPVNMKQPHIKSAVYLTLDENILLNTIKSRSEQITLLIPKASGIVQEIELKLVSVLSKNFQLKVITGKGETPLRYAPGLYYRGRIKGEENSLASVSFFKDRIMGIISNSGGNYVLGKLKGTGKRNYVYYNDADIQQGSKFKCETDDYLDYKDRRNIRSGSRQTTDSVRVYFVADYQMYLDNDSSAANTADFITGFFNSVSAIYERESIPLAISQITVYEIPDPYRDTGGARTVLKMFGENLRDTFPGDLAHLLSTAHNQVYGGISWINVLCQPYNPYDKSGRYAFSNIQNEYENFPVYSYTVYLVAHEIGHNFGSKHTHACVWPLPNGGIGAVDSCWIAEGNCFTQTQPNFNGTIMSYCNSNGAVNFLYGFGPLPGDTIREGYYLARCLDSALNSSQPPLHYVLYPNYPNPFNPSTKISFDIPEPSFVSLKIYDISARELTTIVSQKLEPGTYKREWNASGFASGIYFARLQAGEYSMTTRMVLIK